MANGRPRDPSVDARILAAVRELLLEGGFEELTITAVAKRAGVGRPTVYRRYDSREALAMGVLHRDLGQGWDVLTTQELPREVEAYLMAIARAFLGYYAENRQLARVLLQLSLFAEPGWSERFRDQSLGFLGWVMAGLEERRAAGALRPEVDVGVLAQAFFGLYLVTAVGGASGLMGGLDEQLHVLRGVLRQHLVGLVP